MFKYLVPLAFLAELFLSATGIDCVNDPNTEPGCGNSCVTCSNYNRPCISDDICSVNGCNCISDYIIDEATDTCVLPQDCSIGSANYPYGESGNPTSCGADYPCEDNGDICTDCELDGSTNTYGVPEDGCSQTIQEEPVIVETKICEDDNSVPEFSEAVIEYAATLLNALIQANPDKTVTGGPFKGLSLLGLLGIYSYGETLSEILTELNLDTKNQIRCALSRIDGVLTTDPYDSFNLQGTNIFGNIQYTFTDNFKQDMITVVIGQALNVDFSNPESAADFINAVVAEASGDEITSIVSGDDFSADIQLAAISGYVFKDRLKEIFIPGQSIIDSFFKDSNAEDTEYLITKQVFRYADSKKLKSQVLEITSGIYTVFLILPDPDTDVSCLIDKLGNYRTFNSVINSLTPTVVELYFPNFDVFTTDIDGKRIAQENLDTPLVFDPENAQFENVVVDNKTVSLSIGIQKFIFETNPDVEPSGSPISDAYEDYPTVEMKLNRPFPFLITVNVESVYIPIVCGYRNSAA